MPFQEAIQWKLNTTFFCTIKVNYLAAHRLVYSALAKGGSLCEHTAVSVFRASLACGSVLWAIWGGGIYQLYREADGEFKGVTVP